MVPIFILCVGAALLHVIIVLLNISMQKFFNLCGLLDESNFLEASLEADSEDKKMETPPRQRDIVNVIGGDAGSGMELQSESPPDSRTIEVEDFSPE